MAGERKSVTDPNGKTTTLAYDKLGRLLSKTPDPSLADGPIAFTYTSSGQRATMTDASGITSYSYDSLDRLTTKKTPQGTLTYAYDGGDNVTSIASSNANGASLTYGYDSLNRLASVVDNRLPTAQNTTAYTYDPVSNLATATYPNGIQHTFTYDSLNRLSAQALSKASALRNYQYQRRDRKSVV